MATNGELTELVAELERVRVARDWTYLQLATAMEAVTHRWRDDDCLRRICLGQTEKPHKRTVDIIETFLASVRPTVKRRVRRAS